MAGVSPEALINWPMPYLPAFLVERNEEVYPLWQ